MVIRPAFEANSFAVFCADKNDRDYSQLLDVPLLGCSGCSAVMVIHVFGDVPRWSRRGMILVMGDMNGH